VWNKANPGVKFPADYWPVNIEAKSRGKCVLKDGTKGAKGNTPKCENVVMWTSLLGNNGYIKYV